MIKRVATLTVLALCLAIGVAAQATSQISGTVAAPGGAVIPGATVVATDINTNISHTAQSGASGSYILPALQLGTYKLEVTKQGFKTFTQTGIVLQVGSNPTVNISLQVGAMTQTVEVQANASMVSTENTSVGTVIQPEQVLDLPLNGRAATDLIALSGAAIVDNATDTLDFPTAVGYSIAGSQAMATNYELDGAPNMDYRINAGEPLPFPDALQEFKVSSSATPADSDSRPGGNVSAVTKSGTNKFHGDLFEFLRNGVMDARTQEFSTIAGTLPVATRDNLKRNQFGGTIGGPVLHNKLFFFYGFQGTTSRSTSGGGNAIVPTPAVLAGDFTTFLGSTCQNGKPITLNSTVPTPDGTGTQRLTTTPGSNILEGDWLNTPSAKIDAEYAKLLPAPIDDCGDFTETATVDSNNEYQNVGRVDYQRTQSDTLFARYFVDNYSEPSYLAPGAIDLLSSSGAGLADRFQSVVLGDTRTLSPTKVNSFRFSFLRTATDRTSNSSIPTVCSYGALVFCPQANEVQLLEFSPGDLGYDNENNFALTESLGWQLGTHYLEIGGGWQHVQMNGDGLFQVNPDESFSTGASSYTGENMADFVTGLTDSYSQGGGQVSRDAENKPEMFLQDVWHLNSRLTMNYGVRWDPFYPQHTGYNYAADFSLAAYMADTESTIFPNSPPGVIYPGDPGFNGSSDIENSLDQFEPTVGIAWDPTGQGKLSIHAGYGMNYDTSILWNTMHVVLNPPWGATVKFVPAPVDASATTNLLTGGGVANPFYGPDFPNGDPFPVPTPSAATTFPATGAWVFQGQNNKPSRTQQWNVSLQKQFGANWMTSATYIGNSTSGLWAGQDLDPSVIITAGMTAPGIVSTAGMTGTTGPCTLLNGTQQITYATCNGTSTTSVDGVTNENARKQLSLANPVAGPAFNGGLLQSNSIGRATYNALLLKLTHRLSNGFSVLANYTWAHCLANATEGEDLGSSFQNPDDPNGSYGNCGTDRQQAVNMSLIGKSPHFSSAWSQSALGDWNASLIYTWTTGSPYTVSSGEDTSLTGVGSERPNVVGNPLVGGPVAGNPGCTAPATVGTEDNYFNPCAFVDAGVGEYGDESVNEWFGPSNWNTNAALWRTFSVLEGKQMELRAEAFNLFNHPGLGGPGTSLATPSSLGRISSAANTQRIMQVALKFTF